MARYLIIGRTVGPEGGFEFRWRDANGTLPSGDERVTLQAEMQAEHHDTFKRNAERAVIVVLPAWPDEKLHKHPRWDDGANAGRFGLHVIEES